VRLATVNLLHGRSLSDGRVDPARAATECAGLDADVLGLQEVDRDQPRSHSTDLTREIARACGAAHWRFEPALVGTPGETWRAAVDGDEVCGSGEPGYGVGLVSRHPVTQWQVVRLAPLDVSAPLRVPGLRRTVWVQDEPRVGLCARVETPHGAISVCTTHLSFVPGWNIVQLRRLTAALRKAMPPPYVLLGDLNILGGIPGLVTGWRSVVTAKTFPAPTPRMQLDHILTSGRLPRVRGGGAVQLAISDHRALMVELEDAA
jgi:endonuclease/exonuclease/phosphatase family metal-dependent hydrolase